MEQKQLRVFRKHLREIERQVARTLKDQTTCCGVTMAQCHVLLDIGELGAPSIVELSERLQLDASTLSRTVDGLVKAGLLNRGENPQNRRSNILTLTTKGQETHDTINGMCDEFYQQIFAKIPPQRHESLLTAVETLAQLFGAIEFAGCAPDGLCKATQCKEDKHG